MTNKITRIPYGLNVYNNEEINAVLKTLKNSTQMGKAVNLFENKISKLFSKKYGLMVNSGSSALLLALKAVNFKKGSEIIIPCLNFGTAISSITLSNLVPIFVDCEIDTLQIDIDKIEKKITKKTKAILPVHFAGKSCNMPQIKKIANNYNLEIIEDCAHALGTKHNKTHVGNFGKTGCFSFYPTKNLTTFEGGMVITNSKQTALQITIWL